MARGTSLTNLLLMLQGELGYNTTSTIDNGILTTLINNKALWFSSEYDWPFLRTRIDVNVAAGVRFYNLPALNYERPHTVRNKWNTIWRDIGDGYGVEELDYNYEDSTAVPPRAIDPVQKWMFISAAENAINVYLNAGVGACFEVWPVPASGQTLRFIGQTPVPTLVSGADTLLLDDLLIVKSIAGDLAAKAEQADAQIKLGEAKMRFTQLQSAGPKANPIFRVGQNSTSYFSTNSSKRKKVLLG